MGEIMSDEQWVDDSLMLTKLHDLAREQNNKELLKVMKNSQVVQFIL